MKLAGALGFALLVFTAVAISSKTPEYNPKGHIKAIAKGLTISDDEGFIRIKRAKFFSPSNVVVVPEEVVRDGMRLKVVQGKATIGKHCAEAKNPQVEIEGFKISAKFVRVRPEDKIIELSGSTRLEGKDLMIKAEKAVVLLTNKLEVESIKATGEVFLEFEDIKAYGKELDYAGGIITIIGEPKAWKDKIFLEGKIIRVFLDEKKVEVEEAEALIE